MKLIALYKPFVGTESKFIDSVPEGSKEIANSYWSTLSDACLAFVIILLFLSIGSCVYYFTVYNNQPGRHYKITHWACFYAGSVIATLLITLGAGFMLAAPKIHGAGWLLFDISIGNCIYAVVIFGLLSVLWWLFFPTNAYRPIGNR